MYKLQAFLRKGRIISVFLVFVVISSVVVMAYAAYGVHRPISVSGGIINQLYLYGEESGSSQHRGVDFLGSTGTDVYSIADGVVVGFREDVSDNQSVS